MSLFSRFKSKAKPQTSLDASEAKELNAALMAYVHTFPRPDRLEAHLEILGKLERKAEVEARLQIALKCTENFLYAQVGGVRWNEKFETALFEHVVQSSPWLSKPAFLSLVSFGGWLCWHEGLNAEQTGA